MGTPGIGTSVSGDLVLDAGALTALERGDRHVASLLRWAGDLGFRVFVPASALAQVWRGGSRSAPLARLIDGWEIDALDERRAKEVGVRLGQRRRSDAADAHVVCCALGRGAVVATSDEGDIRDLANPGEDLVVLPV